MQKEGHLFKNALTQRAEYLFVLVLFLFLLGVQAHAEDHGNKAAKHTKAAPGRTGPVKTTQIHDCESNNDCFYF